MSTNLVANLKFDTDREGLLHEIGGWQPSRACPRVRSEVGNQAGPAAAVAEPGADDRLRPAAAVAEPGADDRLGPVTARSQGLATG